MKIPEAPNHMLQRTRTSRTADFAVMQRSNPMPGRSTKITKREKAHLRQLAEEAWEAELGDELERLFEYFCQWAGKGMSASELSDKIHKFHDGVSRELYGRYMNLDPAITVSRAVAIGFLSEESVGGELLEKLTPQIEGFRSSVNE